MVMTPNTANTAAANKIGNYPNIDAIFKNAKNIERNNDPLGRLKSKNSSVNSKNYSKNRNTAELSPKPKVSS